MDLLMDSFRMDTRRVGGTGPALRDVHECGSPPVAGR